jgi:rhamnose transport system ATP-binding protein
VAILFISHRMEEVFPLSDRVTVLSDGRFVSTHPAAEVTAESAIRDMVGRHMDDFFAKTRHRARRAAPLGARASAKKTSFTTSTSTCTRGEVLGFAGLIGSRRTDVGLALFGIETADSGDHHLRRPAACRSRSPQQAVRLGIAYVTEDRRQLGLTMPMSITTNISLPMLRRYTNRYGLVKRKAEKKTAEHRSASASTSAPPAVEQTAGKLSGGNQQKVVLSKWLNTQPKPAHPR